MPSSEPESVGPGFVCFDATPLISFNDCDALGLLEQWVGPVAYMTQAVRSLELSKRPKQNSPVLGAQWLKTAAPHADDAEFVAVLLKRFGKGPPENQGEAETIAACRRYGWLAVIDEEEGRRAAKDHGVRSVYTATLLAAAAGQQRLTPTAAWKLHQRIEEKRGNFSPLKVQEDYKAVFVGLSMDLGRLSKKREYGSLVELLNSPGLDDLLLHQLKVLRQGQR